MQNGFAEERKALMEMMVASNPFFADFGQIDGTAFAEGVISKKHKELTMVTVSIVVKCEPCIEFHVREAFEAGADLKEVVEAIKMGLMASGSTGYPYARHAFGVMKALGKING